MRTLAALILALAAMIVPSSASAGPYIASASKTRAHVGELVRLRAGAGVTISEVLPVYLVAAGRAPKLHRCAPYTLCRPRAVRAPAGAPYHRITTLDLRRRKEVTVQYRTPRLAPGEYFYVFYCGPCYRGRGGSLILFEWPSLTVVR